MSADSPHIFPAIQSLLHYLESSAAVAVIKEANPLFHQLLMTILRRQIQFDWLIDQLAKHGTDDRTRKILRWAMAELFLLTGLPPAITVSIAVDIASKSDQIRGKFVNALLRNLLRQVEKYPGRKPSLESLNLLLQKAPIEVRLSLPRILVKKWENDFGEKVLEKISDLLLQPAHTTLRLGDWPTELTNLANLSGLIPMAAPEWAPKARLFTLDENAKSTNLNFPPLKERMASGAFYIQDPATLLAPALLHVQPGESVADFCCAPGGKSRLLAEALQGQGLLFCSDKVPERLDKVRENLRLFPNVTIEEMDAAEGVLPLQKFNAILLDLPCSNSGVIRRRPDVRYEFTLPRLQKHAALQFKILEHILPSLLPGGRICYSTCSIEAEENQLLIQRFLKHHPDFTLVKEKLLLPSADHDGAYAALLQQRS